MPFSNYHYLFILLLLPVVIIFIIFYFKDYSRRLKLFGDISIIKNLIPQNLYKNKSIKALLNICALIFFALSLADPMWGIIKSKIQREGIDIILALDTSYSMLAEDISPNRIEQAKQALTMLASSLEGNRIGVIAFSGASILQCPITSDIEATKMFLSSIEVGMIPVSGTNISSTIKLAKESFSQKEMKYKALVILTDGEDLEKDPKEIEDAKKNGIVIYTIGFGSKEGSVIPIKDSNGNLIEYRKDSSGKTVITKLDEEYLIDIAKKTGGQYYRSSTGAVDVDAVANDINSMPKKEISSKMAAMLEHRFYYFAAILLLILILNIFL